MEEAWRPVAETGMGPEWMPKWMVRPDHLRSDTARRFAHSPGVDWHPELVRGDPGEAARKLKAMPGPGIGAGGVKLPMALAELGLIDEYEFVIHPRIVGHGPSLFAGLSKVVDRKLVDRSESGSRAVAMRYVARR